MSDFKEAVIDGENYNIKLLPAMVGLDLRFRLAREGMSAAIIFEVVSKCVTKGSSSFDEKKFNNHFKGRYEHLMKVFDEALMFNYPDMDKKDPNVETDTEES